MQVSPVITRSLAGLGVFLTAGMALFAYRYLVPGSPAPDFIAANGFITPWLPVHAAAAATALLVAPMQFRSRLRARRPGLHRVLGRVYVTGCLIGGAAGMVLAFGASTGPVSTAGFGLLALLWVVATSQAWRLAMRRNLVSHREWMIRSFALTLAAVTLRLYLPVAQWLPVEFDAAYRAISFLCWVPNLVVAEVYLRRRRRAREGGDGEAARVGLAT
jgi:uncharacterized membrane protein